MTYATIKAAYRARAKAAGRALARTKLPSAFETGRFVGVDGEGFNTDEAVTVTMGDPPRIYTARDHYYALLSDSDGEEIYVPDGRLDAKRCLDFLLAIRRRDPHAVPVMFGGTYDICHMLAHGVSRPDIEALLERDETGLKPEPRIDITLGDHDFRLSYRPRKQFSIWRWPAGADKYERYHKRDGTSAWRMTPCDKVVLWDVWGFFQGTFVEAMDKWLPNDPDWEFIKREKGNRKQFDRSEIETIRRYNQAEVRCLAAMMNAVRDSIRACDLTVTRWDGVGAVASAMFKKHGVKDHMAETPQAVFDAARVAYSGGHIEACMVGYHDKGVHHYDISSAYPHHFRNLPGLGGGAWRRSKAPSPSCDEFSLVRVSYRFLPGLPFYPLFFRCANGQIIFPERGCGWYWFPEYACARDFADRFGCFEFRVMECLSFQPAGNSRPFAWIEDYFERRKRLVEESNRTGIPNGEQYTLRLGYNACYGKTAQQIGARIVDGEIVPPSYFQLEWAGWVTAGCRAQLMRAAMQKPGAIIAFATDGLFSTEPLDLDTPSEKILGTWEYKLHKGVTMVMPGVYWLHDDKVTHHSRGYDKEQMADFQLIHDAWKRGQRDIDLEHTRMVTLGNACMSEGFWKLRGLFARTTRTLKLNGENSKRHGIAMSRERPHKGLVPTRPRDLDDDYTLACEKLTSAPFPIKFMDGAGHDDNAMARDGASFFLNSADAADAFALA